MGNKKNRRGCEHRSAGSEKALAIVLPTGQVVLLLRCPECGHDVRVSEAPTD
jgi:hypothetical protein